MNEHLTAEEQYDRYIAPVAMISRVISIWPLDHEIGAFERYFRVCHRIGMHLICATMALAISADAARNWNDMDEFTECALIASAFYLSLIRMIIYTIHGKDMNYVVNTMRDDWVKSTPEERLVLQEKCHFSFMLAKQFIVTVAVALMFFMLVPIIDILILHSEERTLPFRGYFYVNQLSSPYYEIIYISTAIGGGLCGSTIASATSFNLVSTMHGAARFGLLQKRLEAIKRNDPECHMAVRECVERHQNAIKFADALERIISFLALGQFAISTGLVCFAGFQITSMIEDKGRLMKYCSFLNSAILELFLFSFSGQQLKVESQAVGDSAYGADWVGSTFTQSLNIIMMRSTVPSKITAAKFYDMSLQSFTSVLSTSFSYFTVLQAMNED